MPRFASKSTAVGRLCFALRGLCADHVLISWQSGSVGEVGCRLRAEGLRRFGPHKIRTCCKTRCCNSCLAEFPIPKDEPTDNQAQPLTLDLFVIVTKPTTSAVRLAADCCVWALTTSTRIPLAKTQTLALSGPNWQATTDPNKRPGNDGQPETGRRD
jgi:hypothetical protein